MEGWQSERCQVARRMQEMAIFRDGLGTKSDKICVLAGGRLKRWAAALGACETGAFLSSKCVASSSSLCDPGAVEFD